MLQSVVFMNTIEATIRNTNTKGEINSLRFKGVIPAIVYGGSTKNQKISLNKKNIKNLIEKENSLSNIISVNIDGKSQTIPLAIFTEMQLGHTNNAGQLALISAAIAIVSIFIYNWISNPPKDSKI